MTNTQIAIGDVHGCASLLEETLKPHFHSGAELIFLGDLIDRAPEPEGDRRVLEQVLWNRDMIWIREPFLSRPHGLPYTVVHGHSITPDFKIERKPGRIGIDTGAYRSGKLTALVLEIDPDPSQT